MGVIASSVNVARSSAHAEQYNQRPLHSKSPGDVLELLIALQKSVSMDIVVRSRLSLGAVFGER